MSDKIQVTVIQTDEGVFWEDANGNQGAPVICQWFAKCGNPATTTLPHPALGDVPICTRCNDRMAE